jgi:hypothetical protein
MLDWDCAEAISIPSLTSALSYIHQHGIIPVSPSPSPQHTLSHPL